MGVLQDVQHAQYCSQRLIKKQSPIAITIPSRPHGVTTATRVRYALAAALGLHGSCQTGIDWAGEVMGMRFYFITFRSVTYAQQGERLLKGSGFRCALHRTPRWMEEQGCGYALKVRTADIASTVNIPAVQKILAPFSRFRVDSSLDERAVSLSLSLSRKIMVMPHRPATPTSA